MTAPAAGSWVSVAVEHVAGALASTLAVRVCQALDACDRWTAAGVAEAEAHGNGATR